MIACAEGALKIIDGKARLISDVYCDGLGACLGKCPEGAITIEERPAEAFDEEAVKQHLAEEQKAKAELPCGCPSTNVRSFGHQDTAPAVTHRQQSRLANWPIQLRLVPPTAPFLQGADVLLAAHCVAFAHPNFHSDLLDGRVLLIACPKLDDFQGHLSKLTQVLRQSDVRSVTVAHMEVPCCSGLVYLAQEAARASGKDIPVNDLTVSVEGEVI
ncbi:MAG: 4Fe-4S ferredoxin [Dehalococcoidia bacterium]|nr:4Fe-4S ferredoxin [Dehalococcoidia bacterium]